MTVCLESWLLIHFWDLVVCSALWIVLFFCKYQPFGPKAPSTPSNSTQEKKSLEIHGILENLYLSTQDAVIKVVEVLDMTIIPSNVELKYT